MRRLYNMGQCLADTIKSIGLECQRIQYSYIAGKITRSTIHIFSTQLQRDLVTLLEVNGEESFTLEGAFTANCGERIRMYYELNDTSPEALRTINIYRRLEEQRYGKSHTPIKVPPTKVAKGYQILDEKGDVLREVSLEGTIFCDDSD